MATNLAPELLAVLKQRDAQTYNKNTLLPYLSGGRHYTPFYTGGGGGGEGGFDNPSTLSGYIGLDEDWTENSGKKGQFYNPDGTFAREFDPAKDESKQLLGLFLAAAGGMGFLPGGAFSSTFGQGSMAAQAGLEGATGATGAAGIEGVTGLNYMNGSDLMSDAFVSNGGYGSGGFGGTSGGYFDNLLNGTGSLGSRLLGGSGAAEAAGTSAASAAAKAAGAGSGLLGPAATLLGAAAGAKGTNKTETETQKKDPRLDPYLFGANGNPGLLGYTQQMLDRQMAPGGLAGYDDMQRLGRGLMAAPVAPNGFNLLTGGRY